MEEIIKGDLEDLSHWHNRKYGIEKLVCSIYKSSPNPWKSYVHFDGNADMCSIKEKLDVFLSWMLWSISFLQCLVFLCQFVHWVVVKVVRFIDNCLLLDVTHIQLSQNFVVPYLPNLGFNITNLIHSHHPTLKVITLLCLAFI